MVMVIYWCHLLLSTNCNWKEGFETFIDKYKKTQMNVSAEFANRVTYWKKELRDAKKNVISV